MPRLMQLHPSKDAMTSCRKASALTTPSCACSAAALRRCSGCCSCSATSDTSSCRKSCAALLLGFFCCCLDSCCRGCFDGLPLASRLLLALWSAGPSCAVAPGSGRLFRLRSAAFCSFDRSGMAASMNLQTQYSHTRWLPVVTTTGTLQVHYTPACELVAHMLKGAVPPSGLSCMPLLRPQELQCACKVLQLAEASAVLWGALPVGCVYVE